MRSRCLQCFSAVCGSGGGLRRMRKGSAQLEMLRRSRLIGLLIFLEDWRSRRLRTGWRLWGCADCRRMRWRRGAVLWRCCAVGESFRLRLVGSRTSRAGFAVIVSDACSCSRLKAALSLLHRLRLFWKLCTPPLGFCKMASLKRSCPLCLPEVESSGQLRVCYCSSFLGRFAASSSSSKFIISVKVLECVDSFPLICDIAKCIESRAPHGSSSM